MLAQVGPTTHVKSPERILSSQLCPGSALTELGSVQLENSISSPFDDLGFKFKVKPVHVVVFCFLFGFGICQICMTKSRANSRGKKESG